MKIYHCVESYFPAVGGMQEVVKQLSERLVLLGHEVIVLTRFNEDRNFAEFNGVKIIDFKIENNPTEAKTKEEKKYVNYLLNNTSDIITFFAAQQWATDLALPILNQIKAKKVSVPTGYSGLFKSEYIDYFEKMKQDIHGYDMNVYLSNDYRDINFAREHNVSSDKIIIIPNGAAEDEFLPETKINIKKELGIPDNHFVLLLVGSYSGWKGHKEAIELFLKSNIKNATLLMIGYNYHYFKRQYIKHPKLAWLRFINKLTSSKKIIFNFFPRDFTVACYKQADLFLFPSNIECSPIVLFECAASSLPFISSDVGNSIEIAEWTKGGIIMNTSKDNDGFSHVNIPESVKLLNDVYKNETLRKKMGSDSFKIWKEKFTWEKITENYEELYLSLINLNN